MSFSARGGMAGTGRPIESVLVWEQNRTHDLSPQPTVAHDLARYPRLAMTIFAVGGNRSCSYALRAAEVSRQFEARCAASVSASIMACDAPLDPIRIHGMRRITCQRDTSKTPALKRAFKHSLADCFGPICLWWCQILIVFFSYTKLGDPVYKTFSLVG